MITTVSLRHFLLEAMGPSRRRREPPCFHSLPLDTDAKDADTLPAPRENAHFSARPAISARPSRSSFPQYISCVWLLHMIHTRAKLTCVLFLEHAIHRHTSVLYTQNVPHARVQGEIILFFKIDYVWKKNVETRKVS